MIAPIKYIDHDVHDQIKMFKIIALTAFFLSQWEGRRNREKETTSEAADPMTPVSTFYGIVTCSQMILFINCEVSLLLQNVKNFLSFLPNWCPCDKMVNIPKVHSVFNNHVEFEHKDKKEDTHRMKSKVKGKHHWIVDWM